MKLVFVFRGRRALAQPFEALAEVFHVARTGDGDRGRELPAAELADGLVDLFDGAVEQDDEDAREDHRRRPQ